LGGLLGQWRPCGCEDLPPGAAVTERQMFSGLAFLLGGHMFCGIVKDALMARLGPEDVGRALKLHP
jgi:hypothetical protein